MHLAGKLLVNHRSNETFTKGSGLYRLQTCWAPNEGRIRNIRFNKAFKRAGVEEVFI